MKPWLLAICLGIGLGGVASAQSTEALQPRPAGPAPVGAVDGVFVEDLGEASSTPSEALPPIVSRSLPRLWGSGRVPALDHEGHAAPRALSIAGPGVANLTVLGVPMQTVAMGGQDVPLNMHLRRSIHPRLLG